MADVNVGRDGRLDLEFRLADGIQFFGHFGVLCLYVDEGLYEVMMLLLG